MPFLRASGILLHPTSFPSRFGIGDFGLSAYRFVDFLVESAQQLWQILPLGPTGNSNSPYASYSARAGNPLLISPEVLRNIGLLDNKNLANLPEFNTETVDFSRVIQTKMPLLRKACENFKANASSDEQKEFEQFCKSRAYWLDDYALFMAIKDAHGGASWNAWEPAIAQRKPEAMGQWQRRLAAEIFYYKYLQFEFFCQWSELKRYANLRGIQIIGDISIYVAHDSADVWANPETFCLKWWVQRFQSMLNYVDLIRIDHFRGFQAYWAVKQGETTAINGEWIQPPGEAFFLALNSVANQAIIPLQDILGLGTEARMNFPGFDVGNWGWRYQPAALTQEVRDRLKAMTETYGRAPIPQEPSYRSIYS